MTDLYLKLDEAFGDRPAAPAISLRSGDQIDSYGEPVPYDMELDQPTQDYLERYWFGISHLDKASWQHYLPIMFKNVLDNALHGNNCAHAFMGYLSSSSGFRDSLSDRQRAAVVLVLEYLAFSDEDGFRDDATMALQHYWLPDADYS